MANENIEQNEQKDSKFKVVDKRCLTEEGEVKTECDCDDESKKYSCQSKDDAQKLVEKTDSEVKTDKQAQARGLITFSMFIQSLAHQTVMCMGLVPWPDTNLVKVNYRQARETIDILQMLREKTKGNIDAADDKMFENMLYELRMTFLNVQSTEKTPKK